MSTTTGKTTSTCDPHIFEWAAPVERGWLCPRCSRINAPWVRQCDCTLNKEYITWTSDHVPGWQQSDEWWKNVTCSHADTDSTLNTSVAFKCERTE